MQAIVRNNPKTHPAALPKNEKHRHASEVYNFAVVINPCSFILQLLKRFHVQSQPATQLKQLTQRHPTSEYRDKKNFKRLIHTVQKVSVPRLGASNLAQVA